ncbi:MAG: hypothetical protein GXY88_02430 [Tissierellia bacterium]|nr:hypothetical protein [Tissierellia bacterium]
MNKKTNIIKSILFLLLIISLLTACQPSEYKMDDMNKEESLEDTQEEEITLGVSAKDKDLLIRSENISDLVVNLYGIDNATAIILNDRVAVGLEMADGYQLTEDLKETINSTILENDSGISQVLISDNKRYLIRLKE